MSAFLMTCLLLTASIAMIVSVWVPPQRQLGRPFWLLTSVIIAMPLAVLTALALLPSDSYGYGALLLLPSLLVFGTVAGGWILGLGTVAAVRSIRSATRVGSES